MLVSVLVYKKEKASLTNKNKIQKSRNSIVYRWIKGFVSPKSKPTSQLNNEFVSPKSKPTSQLNNEFVSPKSKPTSQLNNEHPTLKTDDNLCM